MGDRPKTGLRVQTEKKCRRTYCSILKKHYFASMSGRDDAFQ
jgi:hypothetical protein